MSTREFKDEVRDALVTHLETVGRVEVAECSDVSSGEMGWIIHVSIGDRLCSVALFDELVVLVWLGGQKTVVLSDPNLCEAIDRLWSGCEYT